MFKLKVLCGVNLHAFLLLTLLVTNAAQAYGDQDDVPAPNRLQLFVVGNVAPSSASVSASVASSTATMSTVLANIAQGEDVFTNMVTGDEYVSPPVDYRERPAFVSDVRSVAAIDRRQYALLQTTPWRGMTTGEQPTQDATYMSRTLKII